MTITTNRSLCFEGFKGAFSVSALVRPGCQDFLARLHLLLIALLLSASFPARAAEPEEAYLPIFNLIQQGDTLNNQGQQEQALKKYELASTALRNFQVLYPTFNVKMIAYRSSDVAQKIAAITAKNSPGEPEQSTAGAGASAASRGGGTMQSASVKLLAPGSEPRKQLRLHPKQGDKQTAAMTIQMAMAMKMGETDVPMKLPAINMTMETAVDKVTSAGDIQFTSTVTDVGVAEEPDANPQAADAMKSALGSVKGLESKGTMSNRGFNKGTDIKIPAEAEPQMRAMMEQMKDTMSHLASPMPEEPVGVGAKWEVKMPMKSQGMTINQTATFELVSLEDEKISTKSTIVQNAANQKVQNPAMPGLKMDLIKMSGTGTGETTNDLAQLIPLSGNVDFHSEMSMGVNANGQKQNMDMKMEMKLRIESK